jgi:hypothetical protein
MSWAATAADPEVEQPPRPTPRLDFEIKLETVFKHDDGKWLWFHPRVAAVPQHGQDQVPLVVMTLQKHLQVSDYYSGLSLTRTTDLGLTWTAPSPRAELAWEERPNGITIAVADVTPGWHAPTGKVLLIGAQVRYSEKGRQLEDQLRSNQTAYAVYDPQSDVCSKWRVLEMPADAKFDFARSACAQWIVQPDGTLLLPFYFSASANEPHSVTVVQCTFDGEVIRYVRHGDEIALNVERGLVEPSIVYYHGGYFLTLRNDRKAYVTRGGDGLHYEPIRPWAFDDGKELGSYNTQQHWLEHSDGLFLIYTRRGADNDHILRHRAPLFIAQVDPVELQVIRETERAVVPERGATLGNFGAAAINANESWVTVAEGVWNDQARDRGAEGAVFVGRILWSQPNESLPAP